MNTMRFITLPSSLISCFASHGRVFLVAMAAIGIGSAAAVAQPQDCETITLLSGQSGGVPGTAGQPDDSVLKTDTAVNVGPLATTSFASGGWFAMARSGLPAVVVDPYPGWISTLPCAPQARWINFHNLPVNGDSGSVLYAVPFTVNSSGIQQAVLDVCYACDDRLGGTLGEPNPAGVYINGSSTSPIIAAGSFTTQNTVTGIDITSLVSPGLNWMYFYQRNIGDEASGLIFSATVHVKCGCAPAPPPRINLPSDQLCGEPDDSVAHYSIAPLGPVNNPGGYVTVGEGRLPSGLAGLHVIHWTRDRKILAERLFSTEIPSESIIGTSVEMDTNCNALIAGRLLTEGDFRTFVVKLDPNLRPIGTGQRIFGVSTFPYASVLPDIDVQADWLHDGSIVVYDRLQPAAGGVDSRITRFPNSLLGPPTWSMQYHNGQVHFGMTQFIINDIEQEPAAVGDGIWACGGMDWEVAPNVVRTLPMVMKINTGGTVLQVHAYGFPAASLWASGQYNAIKFDPSIGPNQDDILLAGYSTVAPPSTVTMGRAALISRLAFTQTWDNMYMPLYDFIPGTSALSIAPQSAPGPNTVIVAGRSVGGNLQYGITLSADEATGTVKIADRHGSPTAVRQFGFSDITPGVDPMIIGQSTDTQSAHSQLWLSRSTCPTALSVGEQSVRNYPMATMEIGEIDARNCQALTLVEAPVKTPCTVLCRSCYPNCDLSDTQPVLNVLDFACFLNAFAAGDPYANCDGSTTAPVLNVLDFACFLNQFAAGCP